MQLAGCVALVTGASSGIGREIGLILGERGARPLLAGLDEAALTEVAAQCGGSALLCDLSVRGAGSALIRRALAAAGRVDLLINNAGTGHAGPLLEMSERQIDELLAVNLYAPIELTRTLLPSMRARGSGHIAFVASIAGRIGVRCEAVYAAAKAGVDVFAESLRLELSDTGVGVSVLVPGVVATDFFTRRGQPYLRRIPRPLSARAAALRLVDAIEHDRAEALAPRWLRLPVAMRATLPGTYRRLARRFG